MRILIGCEWSATVRDAFLAKGHDAWSCDLENSQEERHFVGDVMSVLDFGPWDLIILFPPCTYLAVSGNRWYAGTKERKEAALWTCTLWHKAQLKAPRVAMENPVGVLSRVIGKPDQYIQPWQFGHGETKKTGLWLHNLPKLEPTNIVDGREERVWRMAPSEDRAKLRGKTYQGIADAMAAQWG